MIITVQLNLNSTVDEERQAHFRRQPVLLNVPFYRNLMVSNNIIVSFSVGLLAFTLKPFIQRHAYKASFLAHAIRVHSVFGPVNEPMWVRGLKELYH